MSLYNMLNGMNAGIGILVSPFLPMRFDHFPRIRDVFLRDDDHEGDIFVYTRMGGGNADCWKDDYGGEGECDCPGCIAERIEENCFAAYEDDFDFTYKTFVFKVTDHRDDFEKLLNGKNDFSEWYINKLKEMFDDSEKSLEFIDKVLADE